MELPPAQWDCPARIDDAFMSEPLAVRKARAISLKLSLMPDDLWQDQLFSGSMTLESPRVHAEWGFPDYTTSVELETASRMGLGLWSFGHIVPDYPKLLRIGLDGLLGEIEAQRPSITSATEEAFLDSVLISLTAVKEYAARLGRRCLKEVETASDPKRVNELRIMAENMRQVPAGPARTFWQALQSVWTLHMIFHSLMNGNAMGRLDQYVWPYLQADLEAGRIDPGSAAELTDCFCLKFNERAKTTEDQTPEAREEEKPDPASRTRHHTSSQVGMRRDRLDATNHWLQNIVLSGLTPEGKDGTNPLTFLLLESYRRNRMTNPLLTVRLHRDSPEELVRRTCIVLKEGGGMPAIFNDEEIIPSLVKFGIPLTESRDYTNDGCWEVIIPGRTDFRFQRLSLMLCLEWALNNGRSRLDGSLQGVETGDPAGFSSYDEVWNAFRVQIDAMVGRLVRHVATNVNDRSMIAPVPILSALIEGAIASRRDMTAGGARYRTFGMLAESAAHAIDSLTAIRKVIFEDRQADMQELCSALATNYEGHETLRARLMSAPKYGNDDSCADAVGREVIGLFTSTVEKHADEHRSVIRFPAGVGTFSWYIGIGEGLGPSADGRLSGEPVSSNFSPALGMDAEGIPSAILSYSGMQESNLPAGGPIDLRLSRKLVEGEEGTGRMSGLVRGFIDTRGAMMTLTVADTEELRAAQKDPVKYRSLRVRMGGWCAYFTMLSSEQQAHHIRRQEKNG
jgi:formate C-acetyltransferase